MPCAHPVAYRSEPDARTAAKLRPGRHWPQRCDDCKGFWLSSSRPKPARSSRPKAERRKMAPLPAFALPDDYEDGTVVPLDAPLGLWAVFVMERITRDRQPVLANHLKHTHWATIGRKKADLREASRTAFGAAVRQAQRAPYFTGPVKVTARAICGPRTVSVDASAISPTVKALVDGLVDAHLVPDDSPEYVVGEEYVSPARGERWMIELTVREVGP